MNKTKIEWVKNPDGSQGFTSNPISGLCPVGCWYCYGKKLYKRKLNKYFDEQLVFWSHRLDKIQKRKKSAGIFMCSTFEIFHPVTNTSVPWNPYTTWRDVIFRTMANCPQHRFYILTKYPQNIDRPMPDNVYLGVSITKNEDIWRRNRLVTSNAKIKFISFEPLLEDLDFYLYQKIDWIIIGRLTQHGYKHDPKLRWITKIVRNCADYGVKVFLKDNLKPIWGNNLIQQLPGEINANP